MAIKVLGLLSPPRGPEKEEDLRAWNTVLVRYLNDFIYALEETLDALIAGSVGTTELADSAVTTIKLSSGAFSTVTGTANVAIDSAAVVTFTVTAGHTPMVTARCTALLWMVHVATVSTAQVTVIATNRTLSTAGVTVYIDYFPVSTA